MHMTFHSTDPGFCRAYFKTEKGSLVCVQDEGHEVYKVYLCTSDEGEPLYTIKLDGVTMDRIPDEAGADKFYSAMNDWMQRRGLFGKEVVNG